MRLLIVGGLQGQIGLATKIAMEKGAKVTHAADIEQALASLRGGVGADLVFCDVTLDIGSLVRGLAAGGAVVAQVGQIDIVGRHGTILSQWQKNDGQ